MPQRTIRRILTLCALALVSATIALAQSPENVQISRNHASSSWQTAQAYATPKHKIFVVTTAHPDRKQSCRVQSITAEQLVCSRALGAPRTYLFPQIAALILPGDGHLKLRILLGLNAGIGAAIWGTVVLAATCPACAVATGIAAFLVFSAAGAIAIADDQPDRLFYLAPGQQLSRKLGYVERLSTTRVPNPVNTLSPRGSDSTIDPPEKDPPPSSSLLLPLR